MFKACRESRRIMVKKLPINLPSLIGEREIRIGPDDVLVVEQLGGFLSDLAKAHNHNLEIPLSIRQIPALGVVLLREDASTQAHSIERSKKQFQKCLPVFQDLKMVAICCGTQALLLPPEEQQDFTEYSSSYDSEALDWDQSKVLIYANQLVASLTSATQKAKVKQQKNNIELKVPQIKLFAKGWPIKHEVPGEEVKPAKEPSL